MYYKIPSRQQKNSQLQSNLSESHEASSRTNFKTAEREAAYKNPPRPRPNKQDVVARLALQNRILTAEPIPINQAVGANRYRLRVDIAVPGQWTHSEVQAVLDITENWAWRSFLDLRLLKELEQLLDVVALGVRHE